MLNVAGVNRRMLAERLTEADYDFIMDINLKGPFLLSVAVGKCRRSSEESARDHHPDRG